MSANGKLRVPGGNLVANTTAVVVSSFIAPTKETIIETRPMIFSTAPPPNMSMTVKVPDPKSKKQPIPVEPPFKLVFLAVVALTLISIAIDVVYSNLGSLSANQQAVFDTAGFVWKAGIGAIFGLVGGKVT